MGRSNVTPIDKKLEEREISEKISLLIESTDKSIKASTKIAYIALCVSVLTFLISFVFLYLDYIGDKEWQLEQIHLLEVHNTLLERVINQK